MEEEEDPNLNLMPHQLEEERAIVLYDPSNNTPLIKAPPSSPHFSILVNPHFIPALKGNNHSVFFFSILFLLAWYCLSLDPLKIEACLWLNSVIQVVSVAHPWCRGWSCVYAFALMKMHLLWVLNGLKKVNKNITSETSLIIILSWEGLSLIA